MNPTRTTTYLATALLVGGFLLIALGWNGAAGLDYIQGQLPFLISGGVAGIGLIVGGTALALIHEQRRHTALLLARLDALTAAVRGDAPATGRDTLPAPRDRREDATAILRDGVPTG